MKADAPAYSFLGPPDNPQRGGLTSFVTDALRRAIVSLELPPGTVIDKSAICARLGVSRFPVSEALARLGAEGLVDILPQRGSVVSLIRVGEVLEFMLIRKALESEAVRVAARHGGPAMAERLDANLEAQRIAVRAEDRGRFHEHDLEFHDIIFDNMGFSRLKAVIDGARANLDRARRLILTPRRLETTFAEHRRIRDAIIADNGPAAAAEMRAHIDSVVAELVAFARDNPALFADGDILAADAAIAKYPFG
jgi:DNA-binding GntR family transcriptional regulator